MLLVRTSKCVKKFSIILSRRKKLGLERQTPLKLKIFIKKKNLNQERDRFFSPFFSWMRVIQVGNPTKITGTACVSKCSQEYGLNHATLSVLFVTSISYLLKLVHFGIHIPFRYLWGLLCNFTFISILTLQVWVSLKLLIRIAFSLKEFQLFLLSKYN